MSKVIRVYQCNHIGIAGTTPLTIRETSNGFEARMGIAIFGATNMPEEDIRKCGNNPFHEEFFDNYVEGEGDSETLAIESLREDMKKMSEQLWA